MCEQVAVWYHVRYVPFCDVYDSERDAARAAVDMDYNDGGAVSGAQFPDGRVVKSDQWPAYIAAEREHNSPAGEQPPRPVANPFTGEDVEVPADAPAWLGGN